MCSLIVGGFPNLLALRDQIKYNLFENMYKNRTFGVQILSFHCTDYIESIINIFLPLVDKIAISVNEKSWMGNIENNGGVEKLITPYLSDKVILVKGKWESEAEQRNVCLDAMREMDYVFIVDDDELWTSEQIHKMKEFMVGHPGYTVFNTSWNTRFKNPYWRVEPREQYKPTIAIQQKSGGIQSYKGIRFGQNRLIDMSNKNAWACLVPDSILVVEHFSYVRSSDEAIKEKISTFSHANEIINGIDFWFSEIYLQTTLDSRFLHPTHPEAYISLTKENIHPEIESALKKYNSKLFEKE